MNEDKVIQKIVGLEQDMKEVKVKLKRIDLKLDLFDHVLAGQDKMMKILLRVDQERVFANEKISNMGNDIERIKLHLQLA